jgi:hypothetical protein
MLDNAAATNQNRVVGDRGARLAVRDLPCLHAFSGEDDHARLSVAGLHMTSVSPPGAATTYVWPARNMRWTSQLVVGRQIC